MVDTTQSPLAMLVLVTPYTILYVVNQLFLHGVLDKIHYLFFELIFVLAFRKVFGLPDLTERFFSPHGPINIQSTEGIQPLKTNLAAGLTSARTTMTTTGGADKTRMKMTAVKATAFQEGDGIKNAQGVDVSILRHKSSPSSVSVSEPTKTLASTATPAKKKEIPYAQELDVMEKRFMNYINNTEIWGKVYEDVSTTATTPIQVFQYKSRPMCYKILATMNSSPAVVFDALCDLDRRSEWDPMCVEARVLEEVFPGTTVQYVRTKAVWPTASRDTVVLGTVKDLGDKGLFMVNASIEHASMPERVKEKIVRMETAVAGHVITPVEGDENRCRLVQILDADLKGWIPDKVIQMVSTKAVPDGLRAVNALVPKVTPYFESKVLAKAVKAQMEADSPSDDPHSGNNTKESMPEGHEVDMEADPVVEALVTPQENRQPDDVVKQGDDTIRAERTHELRMSRSIGEISLSKLSDRLRALENEIGVDRRGHVQSRHSDKNSSIKDEKGANARALEKKKSGSTFSAFWEGIKENLGFGLSGKLNKIVVAAIVVAVLGSSIAKLKRR
ncbi:START domain-containing protein 10 [Mortierella polycephala]|uniref:START domain-containing protein 10 n=1 Tax=Mortierella polycephala TaxID=41804 RepID=A0A9P6Q5L4_9FUNG|nr:START domain-containing protein 10 [Mortierella polycephala]